VNHLLKSVAREIRTLRSVGTGGGRLPPVTRGVQQWASLPRSWGITRRCCPRNGARAKGRFDPFAAAIPTAGDGAIPVIRDHGTSDLVPPFADPYGTLAVTGSLIGKTYPPAMIRLERYRGFADSPLEEAVTSELVSRPQIPC
jgi:hypothetical protein